MCLIATSDSGFSELPRHFWRAAIAAFTDGMGVMYYDGARIVVHQTLTYDIDALFECLRGVPEGATVAVHLREATYGARCLPNAHPHRLEVPNKDRSLAVMHNGSIAAVAADPATGPSDTQLFAQTWLKEHFSQPESEWHCPLVLERVRTYMGPNNRLVLLDDRGVWRTIGEDQGFQHGRTWLSNPKVREWI